MKKISIFLLAILTLFTFLSFLNIAQAKVISSEEPFTVAEDEVINDDLFVGAQSVTVRGTIKGDLYAAGMNVDIKGTIEGDVLAAGMIVTIEGQIKGCVRAAGMQVNLTNSQIEGSALVVGALIDIDQNTKVGGSIIPLAGTATIAADTQRNIVGATGQLTLAGKVGKNVQVASEELTISKGANITGDLTYQSNNQAQIASEAKIGGTIQQLLPKVLTQKPIETPSLPGLQGFVQKIALGARIWSYLASLIVGLVFLFLFGKQVEKIADQILKEPLPSLLWGFLAIVLVIPIFILLMITVVGIQLGILMLFLLALAIYSVQFFAGILFGRSLLSLLNRENISIYWSLTIGLAVYQILIQVPWLGFLLGLGSIFFGLGSILLYLRKNLLTNHS